MWLGDEHEVAGSNVADRGGHLIEFRLDLGLPVWVYDFDGIRIEKRVLMPHRAEHDTYQLSTLEPRRIGASSLRPSIHFRSYEASVIDGASLPYHGHRYWQSL